MVRKLEVEGYVNPTPIEIDDEMCRSVFFPSVPDRLAQHLYLPESILAQAGLQLTTDIEDFEIVIAQVNVDAHDTIELDVKILRGDGFLPKLSDNIKEIFRKD